MANPGSNLNEIAVILTPELAAFLKKNCEANMTFALQAMMASHSASGGDDKLLSETAVRALIEALEQFKALKQAVEDAGG